MQYSPIIDWLVWQYSPIIDWLVCRLDAILDFSSSMALIARDFSSRSRKKKQENLENFVFNSVLLHCKYHKCAGPSVQKQEFFKISCGSVFAEL
jgi:hypothetical protein